MHFKIKGKPLNIQQAQRNSALNFCQGQREPTQDYTGVKHTSPVLDAPSSSTSILEDPGPPGGLGGGGGGRSIGRGISSSTPVGVGGWELPLQRK